MYKYRAVFNAPEGINNITVYANDSDGNLVTSSTINFTVDTVPPRFTGINVTSNTTELGNNITISINASDASSGITNVLLEYNSSAHKNYTNVNKWKWKIQLHFFQSGELGIFNYTIYLNDSAGNINANRTAEFCFNRHSMLGVLKHTQFSKHCGFHRPECFHKYNAEHRRLWRDGHSSPSVQKQCGCRMDKTPQ